MDADAPLTEACSSEFLFAGANLDALIDPLVLRNFEVVLLGNRGRDKSSSRGQKRSVNSVHSHGGRVSDGIVLTFLQ